MSALSRLSHRFLRGTAPERLSAYERGHLRFRLETPGCPVCYEWQEDFRRFAFWFFAEYYAEPPWVLRLSAWLGFCPRHWWQLTPYRSTYALNHVATYVLGEVRRRLARGFEPRRRGPGCPVCDDARRTCQRVARLLIRGLAEPDIREIYLDGKGGPLCIHHLRLLLCEADGRTGPDLVYGWVRRQTAHRAAEILPLATAISPDPAEPVPTVCPVCSRVEGVRAELALGLAGEVEREPRVWGRRLWAAGGVCGFHRAFLATAAPGALEAAARLLLAEALESVGPLVSPEAWSGRAPATAPGRCPVCETEGQAALEAARSAATNLTGSGTVESLCLPHAVLVMEVGMGRANGELIAGIARRLSYLESRLSWYFETGFREEDQQVWLEALTFLAGTADRGPVSPRDPSSR